jgi:hypothetical protein
MPRRIPRKTTGEPAISAEAQAVALCFVFGPISAPRHDRVIDMLRIVQQSTQLPAAPDALYEIYLDPRRHVAITGSPMVRIAPSEGAEFYGRFSSFPRIVGLCRLGAASNGGQRTPMER